jgi:CheY-like chemotaxis protein
MSKVLVVEDDPAVLSRISSELQVLGHEVLTAEHPEQAISMVEAGSAPELAVLEVSMPEMTGFELAQILHECSHTKKLPVLFMSEAIQTPGTFTDDGVTAKYATRESVIADLPQAIRDLLPEQSRRD